MNLATHCQKSSTQPLFFRTLLGREISPNSDWGRAQNILEPLI